ncbi:MAG: O-antigen ligase family protein, partial [Phycisphaerales bacterium]|nr:O-antigen ligase family protein [Phycisphaerales bacterium]
LGGASYFNSRESVTRFFQCCVVAGLVWSLYSLFNVGDFLSGRQLRFTGGGETNPVTYSKIGVTFLPFMIWAVIQSQKRIWRLAGFAGLLTMPVWIFLSGTRQSIIVAVLANIPLLIRKGALRTVGIWLVLLMVVLFAGSIILAGYDVDWLLDRFARKDLGGRMRRWEAGLQLSMASPIIGRGHGADNIASAYLRLSFHNSYLAIWVNTGIFGLLCVVAVLIGQTVNAYQFIRRTTDPFLKDAAKLALGLMLATVAVCQVENILVSPSGLSIAMLLLISTLITKLRDIEDQNTMAWLSTGNVPSGEAWAMPMNYGYTNRWNRAGPAGRV